MPRENPTLLHVRNKGKGQQYSLISEFIIYFLEIKLAKTCDMQSFNNLVNGCS